MANIMDMKPQKSSLMVKYLNEKFSDLKKGVLKKR